MFLLVFILALPGLAGLTAHLSLVTPDEAHGHLINFFLSRLDSGFQLGIAPYVLRGLLLVLAMLALLAGYRVPDRWRPLWCCSWIFHLWCAISAALSSHPYEALLTVLDTALLNVVALVAFAWGRSFSVPWSMVLSSSAVCYVSLIAHLADPSDPRLGGSFHQPNMTATYAAAALPWLLGPGLRLPRMGAVGTLFLLFLHFLVLILTGTRAAWLVIVLIIGLLWTWQAPRQLRPWHLALGGGVSLLLLYLLSAATVSKLAFWGCWTFLGILAWRAKLSPRALLWTGLAFVLAYGSFLSWVRPNSGPQQPFVQRAQEMAEGGDESVFSRVEFWRTALSMGLEHPLLGVGPKGFHRYYPSYQQDERWFSKYAHCSPLSCWAEVGAIGLLLLVGLAGLTSAAIWSCLENLPSEPRGHLLASCGGLFAIAACACFDVQWQFPVFPVTWAAWLGYSLRQITPEVKLVSEVDTSEVVTTWTLRPRVILAYSGMTFCGLLLAFNFMWCLATFYHEVSELALNRSQPPRLKEAVELAKVAVRLNPFQGSYFHHLGLAALAFQQSDAKNAPKSEEVLGWALRAVALDSHRAVHFDLCAKAHLRLKQNSQATAAMRRAISLDPVNYPSFYVFLAERSSSDIQKERILTTCLRRFPATAYEVMFDFRRDEIARQLAVVYLMLGQVADPSKHPERALEYYEALAKLQPNDSNALSAIMVCQVNLKRYLAARQTALRLHKVDPSEDTYNNLRLIYALEGRIYSPDEFPPIQPSK